LKRKFVFVLLLINCSVFVIAQNISPGIRNKINEVYNNIETYKRTTPQWKQKYDAYITGGDYFCKCGEYTKAINCYRKALTVVPKDPTSLQSISYCKKMLKAKK